ncbi:MAG TPA: hypothetical protein VL961_03060, partial [Acidimicrobiales bacterium]|nr:hypothetical protein [Acidimicrobiales bacterium]
HGTTYSSPYLSFVPKELYTNYLQGSYYAPLDKLTSAQRSLFLGAFGGQASYPFVDFGGNVELKGAQYEFTPFENQSFSAVAAQMGNNSTTIGSEVDAGAKILVQELCTLSHGQPGTVCSGITNG